MDNTEAIAVLQCMVLQRDLHLSPIQHKTISFTMEALKKGVEAEIAYKTQALKPTLEELERVIEETVDWELLPEVLTRLATAILDLLKGEI